MSEKPNHSRPPHQQNNVSLPPFNLLPLLFAKGFDSINIFLCVNRARFGGFCLFLVTSSIWRGIERPLWGCWERGRFERREEKTGRGLDGEEAPQHNFGSQQKEEKRRRNQIENNPIKSAQNKNVWEILQNNFQNFIDCPILLRNKGEFHNMKGEERRKNTKPRIEN